jgi:hypothetical protein
VFRDFTHSGTNDLAQTLNNRDFFINMKEMQRAEYRGYRDKRLNIPNRISKELAAEIDEFKVAKLLKREIEIAIAKV